MSDLSVKLGLSEEAGVRLDALVRKTEAKDGEEVVRNALRMYEALIEEYEAGAVFLIKRSDGKGIQPYQMFEF